MALADTICDLCDGYNVQLPIVFDWENFFNYHEYEISFQDLNHLYDVFEKEVNERGYESMLYGSAYYLNRIWTHKDSRPVWLAQYSSWPTYKHPYILWQLADNGKLDGVSENVDLDVLFIQEFKDGYKKD